MALSSALMVTEVFPMGFQPRHVKLIAYAIAVSILYDLLALILCYSDYTSSDYPVATKAEETLRGLIYLTMVLVAILKV